MSEINTRDYSCVYIFCYRLVTDKSFNTESRCECGKEDYILSGVLK